MSVLKPLVIYHAHCTDGLAAAWCFWNVYNDQCEYHAGVYGKPLPDVVDRDVYIVDFSYKRAQMEIICEFANTVVLLDHHKTALEELAGLDLEYSNLNMTHCRQDWSGAGIAWNYVKEKTGHKMSVPPFLLHVQDRDLWEFKLPGTKAILKAATAKQLTIEGIGSFMHMRTVKLDLLRKQGELLLEYEQTMIKSIVSECTRTIQLQDAQSTFNLKFINVPGGLFSDTGDTVGKDEGCMGVAMYYDTETHRTFGLRSNKVHGIDVSAIATHYGGGGHRNAAGFKVPRSHELAML